MAELTPDSGRPTVAPGAPDEHHTVSTRSKARMILGLVAFCVLLAALVGSFRPRPTVPPPTTAAQVQPTPPGTVARERERMARGNTRNPVASMFGRGNEAADAPAVAATREAMPAASPSSPYKQMGGQADPDAQERAERRRKDAESLHASAVVDLSGRAKPDPRRAPAQPGLADEAEGYKLPTADELTSKILAQMNATAAPAADHATQPTQVAVPPVPAPAVKGDQPEPGLHRLYEGHIFDVTALNRITGDAPGPVVGQISHDVYTTDGTLIVPAGTRINGWATAVTSSGIKRVGVGFHRLLVIQPDGRTTGSYSLDQFPAANQLGDVGLTGKVNRHYLETFGLSAVVGLVSGLSQAVGSRSGGYGGDNNTVIFGGASDSTSQAVSSMMSQFLARPWELTIPEGKRIKVYITADLDLPAYGGFR
jgi:type IV secretory pathway VirB10-like protein